jgi:hypothetical protein
MFCPSRRTSLGAMNTTWSLARRAGVAIAATGLVGSLLLPSAAAAQSATEQVVGGWIGELPCAYTWLSPRADGAAGVPFECVSGTTWDGAFVGHTVYRAVGTANLVTGDLHATLDETLTGLVAATHAPGTLHLLGTVDVAGADGACVVHERMVGGTGAFRGSAGSLDFEGEQLAAVLGHGGYHGTWTHR